MVGFHMKIISIPAVWCAFLLAGAGLTPAAEAPPPATEVVVLPATDLAALKTRIGQPATVEGTLVKAGQSNSGTVRYLNFTRNIRESITLVFFASKGGEAFALEKLQGWVGKKVRATGPVSEYNGQLQIEIATWDAVKEVVE